MASSLTGAALQASRAALSSALAADQTPSTTTTDENLEPGEIQEVDMVSQAENIRTVFSDPTNFNVKVRLRYYGYAVKCSFSGFTASSIFPLDSLVRLSCHKRPQSSSNSHLCIAANPITTNPKCYRCGPRVDGRHQASYQF